MKNAPLTLEFGTVRLPISADGLLHAPTALTQLGVADHDWHGLAQEHDLGIAQRDFGAGNEPTLSVPDFARLAFTLHTPQAKRWRKRAQELLVRAMQGDVRLAAQVAERNPDPEARRWLTSRLESTHARRELMSTVARHGGAGNVYGQLGSISNRSVLGTDSATIRRERGVKATRDGLSSTELLRLAYLDTATNRAIQEKGAQGNDAILKLHQFVARRERLGWETPLPTQAG
ncbi:DNA damage response protein DdrC [Deinococcus sp. KSM4-11]|uniref:DNA damage response protein DdrC n=1 Tax=Deinococcus sp. KSM4-11 TaxID=2568654 RepID=UPI0010A54A49|nr:DNA damage response protein DdrC [Deinococcus sp. KSM4-11]THF85208.1 DNA damage response protein DdrC [Deinococcus sp. KSM4-11]